MVAPLPKTQASTKKARSSRRRDESLSRERIVAASIELLDSSGEDGLTFRALSERLATGPGALYWYIADKSDLLTAACDAVIARTIEGCAIEADPKATIRNVAIGMFDTIDRHPWVGSALNRAPGMLPVVRILERIGQQVRSLGLPKGKQWATASALLSYILGVAGQNAANGQLARAQDIDRAEFLASLSRMWSQLDAKEYPFARSIGAQLRSHDDRADFLAGLELILKGMDR